MRLPLPGLAAALLVVSPSASAQVEDLLAGGRWEQVSSPTEVKLNGKPLTVVLPPAETDFACIGAREDRVPLTFFSKLQQDECTVLSAKVSGGRIALAVECAPQGGDALKMDLSGSYTPSSYTMTFVRRTQQAEGAVELTGSIKGRNLGACRGDE